MNTPENQAVLKEALAAAAEKGLDVKLEAPTRVQENDHKPVVEVKTQNG